MEKRWGTEYIIDDNETYSIKFMIIKKGKHHHLKYHYEKTETLIIVKGTGFIVNGNKFHKVQKGDVMTILPRNIHKLWSIEDMYVAEINFPNNDDGVCLRDD